MTAMMHFTGSWEFNQKMRNIAKQKNMKLNEYELLDSNNKKIKINSENDIFKYLFENKIVQPLDYLEFGVYRGESINWWLNKLGIESNLYGFDSFEGLNEDWYFGCPKGTFKVESIPQIVAPNIRFVKGWFEDSLVPFLSTSKKLKSNLVIHLDADLYIPTIFVLRTLNKLLIPNTIVIFDEFWFVKDEFKALLDFISETGKTFEYIAITDRNVAIKFTS